MRLFVILTANAKREKLLMRPKNGTRRWANTDAPLTKVALTQVRQPWLFDKVVYLYPCRKVIHHIAASRN